MIVKQEIVDYKRNKKTGDNEAIYKQKLNIEYWKNIKEPINVVLDEAHSILNARRSMSKINIIITDWLALIRRILGETDSGSGELVFITQLPNRIDIIARDMATKVSYHVCHYKKICNKCGSAWQEHTEMAESHEACPECGSTTLKKFDFNIEIWDFQSMDKYYKWRDFGMTSFYNHYFVNDIEEYFNLYDSWQWDNLFSELY